MSSRVKKTVTLYLERKPEIDRVRAVRRHTRNSHRAARHLKETQRRIQNEVISRALDQMTVKELREMAKKHNLPRRSTFTKAQLQKALKKEMTE